MSSNIHKKILTEIITICKLFPQFSVVDLYNEDVDVNDLHSLYEGVKEFRERLELDSHVICDDKETQEIMNEGLRIYSQIIKEEMYGED